jgi:hypothetical protein
MVFVCTRILLTKTDKHTDLKHIEKESWTGLCDKLKNGKQSLIDPDFNNLPMTMTSSDWVPFDKQALSLGDT